MLCNVFFCYPPMLCLLPHLDDRHAAAEAGDALVQLLLLVLGLGLRESGSSSRMQE